jgi:hypothetical protein
MIPQDTKRVVEMSFAGRGTGCTQKLGNTACLAHCVPTAVFLALLGKSIPTKGRSTHDTPGYEARRGNAVRRPRNRVHSETREQGMRTQYVMRVALRGHRSSTGIQKKPTKSHRHASRLGSAVSNLLTPRARVSPPFQASM